MVDNEEEKELSLEMGCVKLWRSLLKEEGGDMWGGDTWSNASLEERVWLRTARGLAGWSEEQQAL